MEQFNKRFNELINNLHKDIKPPDASILIYYIEAFSGEMCYQLRDKEPTDIKTTQTMVVKIDQNMQASGRSNLPGFTRGSASKQPKPKGKVESSEHGQ